MGIWLSPEQVDPPLLRGGSGIFSAEGGSDLQGRAARRGTVCLWQCWHWKHEELACLLGPGQQGVGWALAERSRGPLTVPGLGRAAVFVVVSLWVPQFVVRILLKSSPSGLRCDRECFLVCLSKKTREKIIVITLVLKKIISDHLHSAIYSCPPRRPRSHPSHFTDEKNQGARGLVTCTKAMAGK